MCHILYYEAYHLFYKYNLRCTVVICAPFILNTKFINVDFIVLLYILMFMLTRQKDEIYLYVRDHGWLGAMIK